MDEKNIDEKPDSNRNEKPDSNRNEKQNANRNEKPDSNRQIHEEELHFHYDRSKRLENSPDIVLSHYDGTAPTPPKGFFKALVHTRMSRFLFGGLVLSLIMIFFAVLVSGQNHVNTVQGIKLELSAFLFEDTIYITLTANASATTENKIVDISFRALGTDKIPLNMAKFQLNYDGNESFCRTTFIDYDILYIECDVSVAGETATLSTAVSK